MCCGLEARSIWWCFLFFLSGFALMGVGIWTPVDDRVFDAVTVFRPELEEEPAAWRGWIGGLIALGGWSIIVGILGMAGAACDDDRKQRNSLIAFAVLGSLGTIGCLVLGGIATAAFATEDANTYYATLNDKIDIYYQDQLLENDFILAWNRYQIEYECCGVEDFVSYEYSDFTNGSTGASEVPNSCCRLNTDVDTYFPQQSDVLNYTGCQSEVDFNNPPTVTYDLRIKGCGPDMWDRFRQWQTVVMAIAWTATGIQIIALIITGCLKKDAL